MKKILVYISCMIIFLQFFSCKKSKDYVEMIPSDVDFVIQINPKTIAEKAKLEDFDHFKIGKFALEEINLQNPALKEMVNQILDKPNKAGIDIISPIYVFGKKENNQLITSLIANVNDKKLLENQLEILYQSVYNTEIDFVTKDGYTSINGIDKPYIKWNDKQFFFLATEYGLSTSSIDKFFTHIISHENSLTQNNSFKDFLKKSQDVNIWYTANFMDYFIKNKSENQHEIDFSKSSWATFISFNSDNISFTQKFHPDPETKVILEKRPMWKSKINTDFYKYFPAESFFNFSFAIHPTNTRYILNNDNPITAFLSEYDIDQKMLLNSFNGELLFSVFDFKSAQDVNLNDYFNKHENFTKNKIIPEFILAGRMKNRNFYTHLEEQLGDRVKKEGKYFTLILNPHNSIYFSDQHNILYITNSKKQLDQFIYNRIEKINFIQSQYSNRAKNSMFGYANLNLTEYSQEINQYIYSIIPLGETQEVQTLLHLFENFQYNVTDEYTKTATLNFKKGDENTLYRLVLSLDELYATFTNPNLKSHETN